jgi:outer membrane immunogenic protein
MWLPDNTISEIENNPNDKAEIRIIRHGLTTFSPHLPTLCAGIDFYGRGMMSKYRLIKLGLAAVMFASASAVSQAADAPRGPAYRPPPPPIPFYNWTGFYAGAHIGVGWSDGDGGSSSSGFLGGGQVGFNYQINQWVLGLEADIAGTTIKDSFSVFEPGVVATGTASLDWVSTLAPRFGYAFGRWLVYGKFGGAWAHSSFTFNGAVAGLGGFGMSADQTVSGWVLGVGTEYALRDNWTAKIEYNMMDFGSDGPFADNKFHVFKAGLNYRFGGPGGLF